MKEVIVKIGDLEIVYLVPEEQTDDQIENAITTAIRGIGGRPKDRG